MKRQYFIALFLLIFTVYLYAQDKPVDSLSVPSKTTCIQTLKGEVRDQQTNELLTESEVVIMDNTGTVIASQKVNGNAEFYFELECNKIYKVEGRKDKYTPESTSFTTTSEANKELKIIISLGTGEIDFVVDSQRKQRKREEANEELKEEATAAVEEEVEEKALERAKKVKEKMKEKAPEVKAIPKESSNSLKIDPIYFDYESSYLNLKAKRQLQNIIKIMRENPSLVLECKAYADSKGPDNYNQWMSDRRAKRAIDYMINRGISASRLRGKGYGASNILNKCIKDVECTDAERAINRRTEFLVVNM